ncbi:FHA domain-containing protein [Leptothermofonsia sp. ETS-13]|uniref:FHA domain-containing protein n=1 Tax=Leptothermofonsia sp. ETS-13 TaxID=3035696 RepID=UPI003BA1DAB6
MNSELGPTELLKKAADEVDMNDNLGLALSMATSASPRQMDGCGADIDDASFAKVQTLMIDHPVGESDSTTFEVSGEIFKYVQGVVQGQRVYVVTNLLGESEILLQPQMVWTIGRNREAALPLKDRAISRRHAVLLYVQEVGFQLIDLNSMNGSFVNGARIRQRHLLKDGDRIRLGSVNFTFFVSWGFRTLHPIHPEVLARFKDSGSRSADFMDYSALEDPEILFGRNR